MVIGWVVDWRDIYSAGYDEKCKIPNSTMRVVESRSLCDIILLRVWGAGEQPALSKIMVFLKVQEVGRFKL